MLALSRVPEIRTALKPLDSPLLASLAEQIQNHSREKDLLQKALIDDPPMLISHGGVIADGYDDELDDLRAIARNADQYLIDLEKQEKDRTGNFDLEARLQPGPWLLY